MANTDKRTIEGIRLIARDTQKMKIFDKVAYAFGSSAVMDLLNDTRTYQDRYMREFDIYESAAIKYAKIDTDTLRKKAEEIEEQDEDEDADELYCNMLTEEVEKVSVPHSKIMEEIENEIGYYHEVQLYDGSEWFDNSEIDNIDYDDGEKGIFTLKEDEE